MTPPKGKLWSDWYPDDRHILFTREVDDAFQIRQHRARRRRFVSGALCYEGILHINDD